MATSKFVPSTKSALVDEIGDLDARIGALKLQRERLVKRINKKIGSIEGALYKATIFDTTPSVFVHARARKKLGEAAYQACFKRGEPQRRVRITEV